jgi:hypothetical protein
VPSTLEDAYLVSIKTGCLPGNGGGPHRLAANGLASPHPSDGRGGA